MENSQAQNEPIQPQASAGDSQAVSSQPTPPTSEVPEPVIPPEKGKSRIILWVGLGLLVLALVGIGVYYFVFRETTSTPSPTPVPTQAPTPTPDPTADWQTYRNEELKFEFKYPNDWDFSIESEGILPFKCILEKEDNTQAKILVYEETVPIYKIGIDVESNPQNYSAREFYINKLSPSPEELAEVEEITISNVKGIKFYAQGAPVEATMISLSYDHKIYYLSYSALTHEETEEKFLPVFNQILSTFEFTEATPSATP